MIKRGWNQLEIDEIVANPSRTVKNQDTRWLADGSKNSEAATAYIDKSGHYVVKNDRTGDIVQVSNKKDPNWGSPF